MEKDRYVVVLGQTFNENVQEDNLLVYLPEDFDIHMVHPDNLDLCTFDLEQLEDLYDELYKSDDKFAKVAKAATEKYIEPL